MQVGVIGAGYVGLTTSVCLAAIGHDVVCADIDEERIAQLNGGIVPIREDGLTEMMAKAVDSGRLQFTADIDGAVTGSDIIMIAVGTPKGADGGADLSYVRDAARRIARVMAPKTVVTLKSTVAVGTAQELREIIAEERGALDFWVTSNPEFLREGCAVSDFMQPDRIVIGADDHDAAPRLVELYRPLLDRGVPLVQTGTRNAELIKYTSNAFLALKIGFINEVANLCEAIDGDVKAVARGIGLDRRIGPNFLEAGPGYGGSCFPKDTSAFAATGRKFNAPQALVETLIAGNNGRRRRLAERIVAELPGRGPATVAILGVAFKANTDDVRESAALEIIPTLLARGVKVNAFDPWAAEKAAMLLQDVRWCRDPYEAASGANILVILTEWEMFRTVHLGRLGEVMDNRVIFDCRNLLDPVEVARHDFRYLSIGRPTVPRDAKLRRVARARRPGMLLAGKSRLPDRS